MPIRNGVMSIVPEDILLRDHLWDAFGKQETEVSAAWLVDFAKKRGKGWSNFTLKDIQTFYRYHLGKDQNFEFNGLIDNGFILLNPRTNEFSYTELFIAKVYDSEQRSAIRKASARA